MRLRKGHSQLGFSAAQKSKFVLVNVDFWPGDLFEPVAKKSKCQSTKFQSDSPMSACRTFASAALLMKNWLI